MAATSNGLRPRLLRLPTALLSLYLGTPQFEEKSMPPSSIQMVRTAKSRAPAGPAPKSAHLDLLRHGRSPRALLSLYLGTPQFEEKSVSPSSIRMAWTAKSRALAGPAPKSVHLDLLRHGRSPRALLSFCLGTPQFGGKSIPPSSIQMVRTAKSRAPAGPALKSVHLGLSRHGRSPRALLSVYPGTPQFEGKSVPPSSIQMVRTAKSRAPAVPALKSVHLDLLRHGRSPSALLSFCLETPQFGEKSIPPSSTQMVRTAKSCAPAGPALKSVHLDLLRHGRSPRALLSFYLGTPQFGEESIPPSSIQMVWTAKSRAPARPALKSEA